MAAWEQFLTEDDKKVLALRKKRPVTPMGKKTGVLVIDMQITACGYDKPIYEQLDEYSGACGPHAWKSIPYQQKILAAAREVGMPVIYSKHYFKPETGLPASAPTSNFSSLNKNSEIQVEVAMQPGDYLVEKQVPSCFQFTNLPLMLNNLGIDSLILLGNSTSGCVRATAVDARGHNIKCQVVEEGVFDRIEFSHAAALFDMQFKICDVVSFADAMKTITGVDYVEETAPVREAVLV